MLGLRDPDAREGGAGWLAPALRWTTAGLVVAGVHAGGVWLAMNWPHAAEPSGAPPAAMMVELAPLAVAPETPQNDIAPGPEMVETEPEPETEVEPKVEPEKPVEMAEPQPEPEIKTPEPPPQVKAEAVLPPPKVEPPKPVKKKVERKPPAPRTSAPQSLHAAAAERAAAPTVGASASTAAAQASWRSALMVHLNSHKRFPPGGGQGVVTVAFSINRSGGVTSARLVRSSGDALLDAEAVSMLRRASPVPAPPPDVPGNPISLTVPVRFAR